MRTNTCTTILGILVPDLGSGSCNVTSRVHADLFSLRFSMPYRVFRQ